MPIQFISPKKAVNSAYLKLPVSIEKMEVFKSAIKNMAEQGKPGETEEYHKGLINKFLSNAFYSPDYELNTKDRIDLAIYNGKDTSAKAAVLIEVKAPDNTSEMFSEAHPNVKALQELVYYFMQEYIRFENHEIKYLVITNYNDWYFFNAKDFVKFFAVKTNPVYDQFKKFDAGQMSSSKTDFFYGNIARPSLEKFLETENIQAVHFNLKKVIAAVEQDKTRELAALYKFLSPETLLAKPFANDSNSLDKNFYAELLHIIGLEEVKEDGKKVIRRKEPKNRDKASLLESAIYQLEIDETDASKCEEMALRLCITWVNRLLFLKLVESQILMYQKGDSSYKFMSLDKIKSFDELNIFFFKVLGKKIDDRDKDIQKKYPNVPYLNSSLFEPTDDEAKLKIRGIPDDDIEIFNKTVLKDEKGKRAKGTLQNLDYIFKFLDAYNFASDAQGGVSSTNKTLINASVLGLIFEKINGYKDGSFYTPGFITDYMAKDVLEHAVVQKFNEVKEWNCQNIEDVEDKIDDIAEANAIVDDIRIADVAVGSGHFLVSTLNRLLAIKSQLNIFCDVNGKRIKRSDYMLKVDNDELSVIDDEGEPFEYKPGNAERQRIQEALFKEKKKIIENSLFGVDLNPNSVNICRLRLWIELLKNAYYTEDSGFTRLETLPNIDINIKVGDSLLSKYPVQNGRAVLDFLSADDRKNGLSSKLKEYRICVHDYKVGGTTFSKQQLRLRINGLKAQMKNVPNLNLWGNVVANNDIDFSNSMEWMFEFPEILDDEGKFVGFDVVVGNPPYVQLQSMGEMSDVYSKRGYSCYNKSADLYCLFVERAQSLLKKNGYFSYIMPNKWMLTDYGKELRQFMSQFSMKKIMNFGDVQFFADATIYVCIFVAQNSKEKQPVLALSLNSKTYHNEFEKEVNAALFELPAETFGIEPWSIRNKHHDSVLQKMNVGTALTELPITINYGVKTGFNDAFFIDEKTKDKLIAEDPKSAELIKPLLRGRDIEAWCTKTIDQYLINPHNGIKEKNIAPIDINEYPAIKAHLDLFYTDLQKRSDKGLTPYNLRNCAYLQEFAKAKIAYPETTTCRPFSYDESDLYFDKTCFFMYTKEEDFSLKSLCAILNSSLVDLWIWYNCPELNGGARSLNKVYLEKLRIPQNKPEILQELETLADQIITAKKTGEDISALEAQVNAKVYELYGITDPEEIASVEEVN